MNLDLKLTLWASGGGGNIPQPITQFLKLDGTNYMELSEPKTFAGDFKIEIELQTSTVQNGVLLGKISNASDDYIRVYTDTGNVVGFFGGQGRTWGGFYPSDGLKHTLLFIKTNDLVDLYIDGIFTEQKVFNLNPYVVESIGVRGSQDHFHGTIYSAKLTDLATPSNSIEWKIDSGPPVYEAGSELIQTPNYNWSPLFGSGEKIGENTIRWDGVGWGCLIEKIVQVIVNTPYILSATLSGTGQHGYVRVTDDSNNTLKSTPQGQYGRQGFIFESPTSNIKLRAQIPTAGAAGDELTILDESIKPYISTISDGTVYQDSETYGTEPDIMRPDDWNPPPAGLTVSGRTATFDGTQGAYQAARINQNENHYGLHIVTFRVFNVTQGGVSLTTSATLSGPPTYDNLQNGIYTKYLNIDNSNIRVQDTGWVTDRFIGSVEIISVRPVPQGLIMWNVAAEDWLSDIVKPQYLWGTFTATSSTPADTLWRIDSSDPYEVAVVGSDKYTFTTNINNQPIPMTDGDKIDWYIAEPDKVTVLYAYNNQLLGTIPNLSNNTALQYFSIHINQLTGSIPNLSNNTALTNFYVNVNQLTGTIPSLTANTALVNFFVYNNHLTDFAGGWPNKAFTFDARYNKLTVSAVNQILIDADTSGIASGTTIKLEGGTNAAPTGAGLTAKNNLITNGATVTTN